MAQRLSFDERARVEAMSAAGVSVATAARCLGRHRSTVHRELRRGRRDGVYDAEAAQAAAAVGAARPKIPVLAADPELAASVRELLKEGWSPHAICAGLRAEGRTVSAETIYRAAYDHSGSSGLPEGSWRCLPRRRRRRKPRGRCTTKPSPLGDFRPVCERPAATGDRSEPGHWEGDLIIGAGNRSAVATLVERLSRQTLTVALPDGYDAHRTADAVAGALSRQPRHMVKTLTWDQGREMARWQHVENATGAKVYFCEPRSPWQRPTNEQTNCEYRGCALERAPDWSRRRGEWREGTSPSRSLSLNPPTGLWDRRFGAGWPLGWCVYAGRSVLGRAGLECGAGAVGGAWGSAAPRGALSGGSDELGQVADVSQGCGEGVLPGPVERQAEFVAAAVVDEAAWHGEEPVADGGRDGELRCGEGASEAGGPAREVVREHAAGEPGAVGEESS